MKQTPPDSIFELESLRHNVISETMRGHFPLIHILAFQAGVLVHETATGNSNSGPLCHKESLTYTHWLKFDLCLNEKTQSVFDI